MVQPSPAPRSPAPTRHRPSVDAALLILALAAGACVEGGRPPEPAGATGGVGADASGGATTPSKSGSGGSTTTTSTGGAGGGTAPTATGGQSGGRGGAGGSGGAAAVDARPTAGDMASTSGSGGRGGTGGAAATGGASGMTGAGGSAPPVTEPTGSAWGRAELCDSYCSCMGSGKCTSRNPSDCVNTCKANAAKWNIPCRLEKCKSANKDYVDQVSGSCASAAGVQGCWDKDKLTQP
jgi:hypothetical protein